MSFFGAKAPPLFLLNSWDKTSELNAVRKQRGLVTKLVRGCYLAVKLGKGKSEIREVELLPSEWYFGSNLMRNSPLTRSEIPVP